MFDYSGFSSNEERRRRLLSEALGDEASSAPSARGRSRGPRSGAGDRPAVGDRYPDPCFLDQQPRLIDLIPTRWWIVAALFLLGLGVIAGLEVLYCWMPRFSQITSDGRIAAFDLDGEGSLAVWVSSMMLALAAAVAVIVFMVRRHRSDDYQGYYRIWLWAAACWLVMSVDETASLHEGFKELMAHASGTRLAGDGSLWWVIPYFFVLAAVGLRLLADMRDYLPAAVTFLLTAFSYATAVAFQLGWLMPESGARGVMFEEGAELLGDLLLLTSMLLYARFVILEAQGRLRPRARSTTAKTRTSRARSATTTAGRIEPAHPIVVRPPRGVRVPATASSAATEETVSTASEPAGRKSPLAIIAGWFGKRAAASDAQETDSDADSELEPPESEDLGTDSIAPAARRTEPSGSIGAVPVPSPQSRVDSPSTSAPRRLSKAERKAMRKRLRRLRAERERRMRSGQ